MAKRRALLFDQGGLTEDLKASTGQGMGALFSTTPAERPTAPDSPAPSQTAMTGEEPPQMQSSPEPAEMQSTRQEDHPSAEPLGPPADPVGILPLDEADIEELREPAYQAQTFRLTQAEIQWIKDTAYRLSKELRRGKAAQADILRISLRLFQNLLVSNKSYLISILKAIN